MQTSLSHTGTGIPHSLSSVGRERIFPQASLTGQRFLNFLAQIRIFHKSPIIQVFSQKTEDVDSNPLWKSNSQICLPHIPGKSSSLLITKLLWETKTTSGKGQAKRKSFERNHSRVTACESKVKHICNTLNKMPRPHRREELKIYPCCLCFSSHSTWGSSLNGASVNEAPLNLTNIFFAT